MQHMAYKYRVTPTKEQRRFLAQTFECARYVWNWALEYRTNATITTAKALASQPCGSHVAAMCKEADAAQEG